MTIVYVGKVVQLALEHVPVAVRRDALEAVMVASAGLDPLSEPDSVLVVGVCRVASAVPNVAVPG